MAAADHLSGYQFASVPSDSGSLLDADLPMVPGGADEHVQVISDLAHAHATAANAVRAVRGDYPFVTRLSDAGDALTGMGVRAGRGLVSGALSGTSHALGHESPFHPRHVESPEQTGRGARDWLHPY